MFDLAFERGGHSIIIIIIRKGDRFPGPAPAANNNKVRYDYMVGTANDGGSQIKVCGETLLRARRVAIPDL